MEAADWLMAVCVLVNLSCICLNVPKLRLSDSELVIPRKWCWAVIGGNLFSMLWCLFALMLSMMMNKW